MRKGMKPALVLDSKGEIFAIVTGSDATSEHEWGSKPLMLELTGAEQPERAAVARHLKEGRIKEVPDLLATRRITHSLDQLVFQKGEEQGEPVAALGFTARCTRLSLLTHPELAFNRYSEPQDRAGAWDDSSFGFKVKGAKLVAKLERFADALRAGHGMFAGTFLANQPTQRLAGVIICDTKKLRPEHRQAMKKAQAEFIGDVQLHVQARTDELSKKANQVLGARASGFGRIWPEWKDGVAGGDIRYGYNPGYNMDKDLYGFYSFEELMAWLEAGARSSIRVAA